MPNEGAKIAPLLASSLANTNTTMNSNYRESNNSQNNMHSTEESAEEGFRVSHEADANVERALEASAATEEDISLREDIRLDILDMDRAATCYSAAACYSAAPVTAPATTPNYSAAENRYSSDHLNRLSAGKDLFKEFDTMSHKKMKSKSKLVTASLCHCPDGSTLALSQSDIMAPINQCVAYSMGFNSRYSLRRCMLDKTIKEQRVIDRPSNYIVMGYAQWDVPFPLSNRDVVVVTLYQKLTEDEAFTSLTTCEHPDYPISDDIVRINLTRAIRYSRIKPTLTKVEILTKVNPGGVLPQSINNLILVPQAVDTCINMVRYFAHVREPTEYTSSTAEELGQLIAYELLHIRANEEHLRKGVVELFKWNRLLCAAQAKYFIMEELLYQVMQSKLLKSRFKVNTPLSFLSVSDAGKIGKSLNNLILCNMTGAAAVDEWILAFPALAELAGEYDWFTPLFDSVAVELLSESLLGVLFRMYFGAAVSILDTISDVYIIRQYMAEGRGQYAVPLIAMVGACFFLQMLIVFLQYKGVKEDQWKHILLNWLYVLACVKPGIDAHKLASGAEQLPGAAFDALSESVFTKNLELFCEALPGFVLQSIAFMESKDKSRAAALSLVLSAASASLTSTATSYDNDTNPKYRKQYPDKNGFVPDIDRGLVFGIMYSLGSIQIVAKGLSVALLAVTNSLWLIYYLVGDMAIFLLYKLATRDFLTWHPFPLSISIPFSIFMRVITKSIADFSGSIISKTPEVLGGAYFSYGLLQNKVSVLIAVHLYNEHAGDIGGNKLSGQTTWAFAIALVSTWVLLYGIFLFHFCVPEYRHLFWSTTCGHESSKQCFLSSDNDERRFTIFQRNRAHWSAIEGDVKKWTFENWPRWDRDRPSWFTNDMIARVPDEFIPRRYLRKMGKDRRREGLAVDSAKESLRRMSQQLLMVDRRN